MKFGGTSVGSPSAIERVCSIIQSRADRHPLVVVSAIGDTTDRLVEAAEAGPVGGADVLTTIRDRTEAVTRAVVSGGAASEMVPFLDEVMAEARDLLQTIDSRSDRASPSAELDALLGIGERISSRLVTLALIHRGLAALNLDSRELFVSEARHGGASPLIGPTRERLRKAVPQLLSDGTSLSSEGSLRPVRMALRPPWGEAARTTRRRLRAPHWMPRRFKSGRTWMAS